MGLQQKMFSMRNSRQGAVLYFLRLTPKDTITKLFLRSHLNPALSAVTGGVCQHLCQFATEHAVPIAAQGEASHRV